MRIVFLTLLITVLATLLGCKEEGHCYYNCPDDPGRICGTKAMDPDDNKQCEDLATQKCTANPGHLITWEGEVMHEMIICKAHEVCGLPDWCKPNDSPGDQGKDSAEEDTGTTIAGTEDSGVLDAGSGDF